MKFFDVNEFKINPNMMTDLTSGLQNDFGKCSVKWSLFGGGSDIESFYSVNGGAFLSLSIKSRIYLAINKTINNEIKIHYSQTEIVKDVNTIKHDLVREALKLMGITGDLEIGSFADIPTSGTGLGSSSTFSVALLGGLNVLCGHSCSARDLAEQACHRN